MTRIRRSLFASALIVAAAFAFAAPAEASHQQYVVLQGNGLVATNVIAPAGWVCTPPALSGGTWETRCIEPGTTWCAEPLTNVGLNGLGGPIAFVVGETVCESTGPSAAVSSTCMAVLFPAMTSASCSSGITGGYASGAWVETVCRGTPGGLVVGSWKVTCGNIVGP